MVGTAAGYADTVIPTPAGAFTGVVAEVVVVVVVAEAVAVAVDLASVLHKKQKGSIDEPFFLADSHSN